MDSQTVNTGFVLSFSVIRLLFLLPLPFPSKFMTILDFFCSHICSKLASKYTNF